MSKTDIFSQNIPFVLNNYAFMSHNNDCSSLKCIKSLNTRGKASQVEVSLHHNFLFLTLACLVHRTGVSVKPERSECQRQSFVRGEGCEMM